MERILKECFCRSKLNHISQIHDTDCIRDMLDDREVMADEEICKPELFLKTSQEVDDLCLDGYVKSRNRFIAEDEIRVKSQSSCDTDSLSLSTTELMWISGLGILRKATSFHYSCNVIIELFWRNDFMFSYSFTDDFTYGETRRK